MNAQFSRRHVVNALVLSTIFYSLVLLSNSSNADESYINNQTCYEKILLTDLPKQIESAYSDSGFIYNQYRVFTNQQTGEVEHFYLFQKKIAELTPVLKLYAYETKGAKTILLSYPLLEINNKLGTAFIKPEEFSKDVRIQLETEVELGYSMLLKQLKEAKLVSNLPCSK